MSSSRTKKRDAGSAVSFMKFPSLRKLWDNEDLMIRKGKERREGRKQERGGGGEREREYIPGPLTFRIILLD